MVERTYPLGVKPWVLVFDMDDTLTNTSTGGLNKNMVDFLGEAIKKNDEYPVFIYLLTNNPSYDYISSVIDRIRIALALPARTQIFDAIKYITPNLKEMPHELALAPIDIQNTPTSYWRYYVDQGRGPLVKKEIRDVTDLLNLAGYGAAPENVFTFFNIMFFDDINTHHLCSELNDRRDPSHTRYIQVNPRNLEQTFDEELALLKASTIEPGGAAGGAAGGATRKQVGAARRTRKRKGKKATKKLTKKPRSK
jgi:hypothetical protein